MLVSTGGGEVMVRLTALEDAVPVFAAVTGTAPGCAIEVAGTAAVSWVLLTKVVANAAPFKETVAPLKKLVPVTVNVNAGLPAATLAGEMLVIVGTGGITVKFTAFDMAVPVFVAVMGMVAGCRIRLAGTAAVTCVALTKLVLRPAPFPVHRRAREEASAVDG